MEYLVPIKYNSSNTCYSGTLTKLDLVLVNFPNSKQDSSAFVCPVNMPSVTFNISWLGFPFKPESKLTFPCHHLPTIDCTNLHPLLHLGSCSFLTTTSTILPFSTGSKTTLSLAVYHIPYSILFSTMVTSIGHCPECLTVSIPFYTASLIQFVPWQAAVANATIMSLTHPVFDIPPPIKLKDVRAKIFHSIDFF